MKWGIIAANKMLAAKHRENVVDYFYWQSILEDCFPGNDLVMCCEDKEC